MSRTHASHLASVLAVALFTLLACLRSPAQEPAPPAVKSESAADPKTDEPAKVTPEKSKKADPTDTSRSEPEFVRKSDAEWRKILTRVQYAVTRQKWTEPAFSGRYASGHYRGSFLCVCCSAAGVETELFRAQHKFESGTGWPSFYQPAGTRALETANDFTGLEPRVEVACRRCGAHLGHVFDDGPAPTGLRYCINSAAIKLKPPDAESTERPASSKTSVKSKKSRAKARAKGKSAPTSPAAPSRPRDDNDAPGADPPGGSDPAGASRNPQAPGS